MDDAELNAIRAARLAELQKNTGAASAPSKQDEAKLSVLSQLLEPQARERLSRVRIVRPQRADQVEQYVMKLYSMGQISQKLTEKDIVQILDGISRDSQSSNPANEIVYDRRQIVDDDDDDFFD